MVVDIRVVGIVLDSLVKALERLLGVTLFHVNTSYLD